MLVSPGPNRAATAAGVGRRTALLTGAALSATIWVLAAASAARAAIPYTAYVGNYTSGTLTPVNTATNASSPNISVSSPSAIAITPDGTEAYVCNYEKGKAAGSVTPITLATGAAGSPITVGAEPISIAIAPDGTQAYVANYNKNEAGTVTVITLATGATSTIPVGKGPYSVAITPDGTKAYVANHYDATVTPITTATNTPGTPITVGTGGNISRTDWVAITPDGSKAFAANFFTNEIVPITVATNTAGTPITGVKEPNAMAITPDGATAFIAEEGVLGHVVPMTLSNDKLGSAITVANNPYDIAVTPDQASAYVANYNNELASVVTPINLLTNTAGTNITAGIGPDAVAITPDQAPVGSFTASAAPAGAATSFDASASTVTYGSIVSYAWNFGDGSSAATSAPTTTHVYAAAGRYTVTLTETDSAGTSTAQVFTGKTLSRNGGPSAFVSRLLRISAAPPWASGSAPGPTAPASPKARPAFGPSLASAPILMLTPSVATTRDGNVVIAVSCPASALGGCRGAITIRLAEPDALRRAHASRCARGCRALGSAQYQARAGQKVRVRVHIASFARKLLVRRKALPITVTATSVSGGRTATTARTTILRAKTRGA